MHVLKPKFHNNPNIGLYGFATDSYCLLPKNLSKRLVEEIEEVLDVPVYQITIYNTNLIGVFCAGNEDYLFVPDMISEYELKELEKIKEVEIIQLHTRFTALGNNIAIKELVLKYGLIDEKDLNKILSPQEMTEPKEPDKEMIIKIKNSESYKRFLQMLK